MKKLFPMLCLFLIGCAAPLHIKEEAGNILISECQALFLNGSLGGYQHVSNQFNAKAIFALAYDEEKKLQVCSYASKKDLIDNMCVWDCFPTMEQVEANALTSCEAGREETAIKSVCKVFARNNEIVWKKDRNEKIDFQ